MFLAQINEIKELEEELAKVNTKITSSCQKLKQDIE